MRGRHFVVGCVALVALAGCHDGGGKKQAASEVTGPAASAAARDAFVEQLRAIDPKLVQDPKAAVVKGEAICADIARDLRWSQIAANAEAAFGVDEDEMAGLILPMTQHVLCPAG